MLVKFTNDLYTGNDRIDQQHKEWFKRLDKFWRAARQGNSTNEVIDTLIFLQEYVQIHFEDEERLQKEIGYPGYSAQKNEHDEYIKDIGHLIDSLQKKGADFPISVDTLNSMMEWVVKHISTMDKDLANYIREKNGKSTKSVETEKVSG